MYVMFLVGVAHASCSYERKCDGLKATYSSKQNFLFRLHGAKMKRNKTVFETKTALNVQSKQKRI